jgi:hypothetical protein
MRDSKRRAGWLLDHRHFSGGLADRGGFELALSLQRREEEERVRIKEAMSVANRRGNGRPTRGARRADPEYR